MTRTLLSLVLVALLTSSISAANWWENIKIKGDLRYRHEMIKKDSNAITQNRHRMRARFGIFAKASDYTTIGIQLATGSADPVSTNQTLGDGFSSKGVVLDMAYFEMTCPRYPGLALTGGKFQNPFFTAGESELMWDSDWNPEGGVVHYNRDLGRTTLNLTGAGLLIQERSSDKDSYLAAGQGALAVHFNEKKSSFTFGGGYFYYGNAKSFAPFYDADKSQGNTVMDFIPGTDTMDVYANDFEIFEAFAEFTHRFNKIPVTIMGDFVTNTGADSLETGWLVGMHIGAAKEPGTWALRYNYRKVEKDAVIGIFTDSDFRGGGTDAKGHEMGGSLVVSKNAYFNVSYFVNTTDLEAANQKDFTRLQVDLQLKFK